MFEIYNKDHGKNIEQRATALLNRFAIEAKVQDASENTFKDDAKVIALPLEELDETVDADFVFIYEADRGNPANRFVPESQQIILYKGYKYQIVEVREGGNPTNIHVYVKDLND